MKSKCNFYLPETRKLCWYEEPVVFDEDPVNRSYKIIKIKRKLKENKKLQNL